MKRFVVGDIHGGYRALVQVLERSGFDNEKDTLISLGDIVDGWSETHLVIEKLMEIKSLIYLFGNHDTWFMRFVRSKRGDGPQIDQFEMDTWLSNGGLATINPYKNPLPESGDFNAEHLPEQTYKKELLERHYDFLKSIGKNYHVEDNMLFVHAGYDDYKSLEENDEEDLLWDRWFWREVYMNKNENISQRYDKVFIGHTPTINWNITTPIKAHNVWNVDTGAAFNGKLTIMNVDTEEYFQSDPIVELYPNEQGRNRRRG